MKTTKFFTQLTVMIILQGLFMHTWGQFTGDMVFNAKGQEKQLKVYSAEAGYRYEFDENGQKGAIIVKNGSDNVIILMPDQKMAMNSPAASTMSMNSDPLKAFEDQQEKGILKEEGKETINGIDCTKSTLWSKKNPGQKMYTIWVSEKYKFPMKMINHVDGSKDSGMEMKNVKSWTPDNTKFEIPKGYQVMGMPGMGR